MDARLIMDKILYYKQLKSGMIQALSYHNNRKDNNLKISNWDHSKILRPESVQKSCTLLQSMISREHVRNVKQLLHKMVG